MKIKLPSGIELTEEELDKMFRDHQEFLIDYYTHRIEDSPWNSPWVLVFMGSSMAVLFFLMVVMIAKGL